MQVSAKAIRMGAADAAAAAIIAVAESEGTAKALDKLGETEQLAQMREMEAAMNGGGAGGGVVAAPPRIVDIDAVIEFEFGNAFKDPMWDEIVGDREHTIRGQCAKPQSQYPSPRASIVIPDARKQSTVW